MSIFGNSLAITRYRVHNDAPLLEDLVNVETYQKALAHRGFRSIIEGIEEVSVGWVHINDQEAATFDNPGYLWIGEFLVFSLRRDTRVIPPLIFVTEIKKECDKFLADNPNYRSVPKVKRLEIRDNVKQKLLARQLPDSHVWDVAWDIKAGMIYLFNTSRAALDTFEKLFKVSFPDFALRCYTPYHQSCDVAKLHGFDHALGEKNQAASEAVTDLIKANGWIGRDLLLWLLAGQGQSACEGISAWVDCKIDMAGSTLAGGVEKISFTNSQSEGLAVKAALKGSHWLTKCGVFIEDGENNVYSFVLAGETFAITQLKTPMVKLDGAAEDALSEYQAVFLEKLALIQKGLGYLEQLLGAYIEVRVTSLWANELRAVGAWLEE